MGRAATQPRRRQACSYAISDTKETIIAFKAIIQMQLPNQPDLSARDLAAVIAVADH
jgi:hypothetical protein